MAKYTIGQRIAAQQYCLTIGIPIKYWRDNVKVIEDHCQGKTWITKQVDQAINRIKNKDKQLFKQHLGNTKLYIK